MSLRRRRAAAPVSSSASMTTRPATMWIPPANLKIEATSALRQHAFVIVALDSSDLTWEVSAMWLTLRASASTLEVRLRAELDHADPSPDKEQPLLSPVVHPVDG